MRRRREKHGARFHRNRAFSVPATGRENGRPRKTVSPRHPLESLLPVRGRPIELSERIAGNKRPIGPHLHELHPFGTTGPGGPMPSAAVPGRKSLAINYLRFNKRGAVIALESSPPLKTHLYGRKHYTGEVNFVRLGDGRGRRENRSCLSVASGGPANTAASPVPNRIA